MSAASDRRRVCRINALVLVIAMALLQLCAADDVDGSSAALWTMAAQLEGKTVNVTDAEFVVVTFFVRNDRAEYYEQRALELLDSCQVHNIDCRMYSIAQPQVGYAFAYKPWFMLERLLDLEKPILFVDSDLQFQKYPLLLTRPFSEGIDFMPFNNDAVFPPHLNWNGWRLRCSSGVMWWNYTTSAVQLLKMWNASAMYDTNVRAADDQVLDQLFNFLVSPTSRLNRHVHFPACFSDIRVRFLPRSYIMYTFPGFTGRSGVHLPRGLVDEMTNDLRFRESELRQRVWKWTLRTMKERDSNLHDAYNHDPDRSLEAYEESVETEYTRTDIHSSESEETDSLSSDWTVNLRAFIAEEVLGGSVLIHAAKPTKKSEMQMPKPVRAPVETLCL